MLAVPACMEGAVAVALPGLSLQEVLAVHDAHPSWVSTKQRRVPGQRCQKQKSPPRKAKQAPTSRPLPVCVCHIATMPTCAGEAMLLKKAVACVQYAEDDTVLTMHMGNAVTENTLLPLFAVGKSKEAYTAGQTPISQHKRVKTVLT
jgi:hypothetical protein